jgi:hypothetical protein
MEYRRSLEIFPFNEFCALYESRRFVIECREYAEFCGRSLNGKVV